MDSFINPRYIQKFQDGKLVPSDICDTISTVRSSDSVQWGPVIDGSTGPAYDRFYTFRVPKAMVKYPELTESNSLCGWLYRRDLREACADTVEVVKDQDVYKAISSEMSSHLKAMMQAPGMFSHASIDREFFKGSLGVAHDHVTEED